jgi:tetratricopeptide (TPR) repeat protein
MKNLLAFTFLMACLTIWHVQAVLAHPVHSRRLEVLNDRIREEPHSAMLYLERGDAFVSDKHWSEAEQDFLQAVKLDEKSGKPELHMARMWLKRANPKVAFKYCEQSLKKDKTLVSAHLLLAEIYSQMNQHDSAARTLTAVINQHPMTGAAVYLAIEGHLKKSSKGQYGERIQILQRGVDTLGPLVVLLAKLIELEIERNNPTAALSSIKMLPQHVQQEPKWLLTKAQLLSKLGKCKESELTLIEAKERFAGLNPRRSSSPMAKKLKTALEREDQAGCESDGLAKK